MISIVPMGRIVLFGIISGYAHPPIRGQYRLAGDCRTFLCAPF